MRARINVCLLHPAETKQKSEIFFLFLCFRASLVSFKHNDLGVTMETINHSMSLEYGTNQNDFFVYDYDYDYDGY